MDKIKLNKYIPDEEKSAYNLAKEILDLIEYKGYIAGGFATFLVDSDHQYNDIDIFCKTPFAYTDIKNILLSKFEMEKESNFSSYYNSSKRGGISSSGNINLIKPNKVQRNSSVGPPEKVISQFDFINIQCAVYDPEYAIVPNEMEFEHAMHKKLIKIANVQCPLSVLPRLFKYIKKGYTMEPIEMFKILDYMYTTLDTKENKEKFYSLFKKLLSIEEKLKSNLNILPFEMLNEEEHEIYSDAYEAIYGQSFFK